MSCPFSKDSLDKLKAFIDFCSRSPEVIHLPELSFFKSYLQSLGANLPKPPTMSAPKPENVETDEPVTPEPENTEEQVESESESELEFDTEGCVEPDVVEELVVGDDSKVPTEEELDMADELRIGAMSAFSEGELEKSVTLLNDAIQLNPGSAVLFVKRGQSFLKLGKPNACIKDCTKALELNPDSAAGYKYRGRAHRLLGNWEDAAKDLRQACKIDMDEQTDEWLKEVTPNAQKIEQHRLKLERKKAERELRERAERIRKAKEAHAKAAAAQGEAHAGANSTSEPEFGGGAAGGMGDFYKLLQDPEVMAAFKDPEVAAAFQDISLNPTNFVKYQSNPKIMALITKLSSKFQGSGMGFPGGMGGFPGGFPGFPGAGAFGAGGGVGGEAGAKPPEDDGLD